MPYELRAPRVNVGQPMRAAWANAIAARIDELARYYAENFIDGQGADIDLAAAPELYLCTTTSTVPSYVTPQTSGQPAANYTDARYWLQMGYPAVSLTYDPIGTGADVLKTENAETSNLFPTVITGTNLAEWSSGGGTHNLPDGTNVIAFAFPSKGD